jgi:hypothetical protein
LGQTGIAIGQSVFKPWPLNAVATFEKPQEAFREPFLYGLGVAITFEGPKIFGDP